MEILNIKKALERRLSQIVPSVPTGYEGVTFDPPLNSMYQRCQFVISSPDDPVFPAGYHRERVTFQVFVADIKGKGTAAAISRAEIIRNAFAKGSDMIEGDVRLYILQTPQIGSAFIASDRIIVPVIITVLAEVSNY